MRHWIDIRPGCVGAALLLCGASGAAASPFWGTLAPGPHPSGLRIETIDVTGTPVQVVVWYPARAAGGPLSLGALLRTTCIATGQPSPPEGPGACEARLVAELRESRGSRVSAEEILGWSSGAASDAPPQTSRSPLIVFDGGLRSDALSFFALAAHLATHGVVSVSVPSVPARPGEPLTFDAAGVRRKADIVRAAIRAARAWPNVDPRRVVVAAWSVGGISAAVAAREEAVGGVLSLDGGLGYDYGAELLRQGLPSAARGAMPVLHLTGQRPNPFPVPKDTAALTAFSSRTWQLSLAGIHHSHFIMQGGAVRFAGDDTAEAAAFWGAFEAIAAAAREFVRWVTTPQAATEDFILTPRAEDRFQRVVASNAPPGGRR